MQLCLLNCAKSSLLTCTHFKGPELQATFNLCMHGDMHDFKFKCGTIDKGDSKGLETGSRALFANATEAHFAMGGGGGGGGGDRAERRISQERHFVHLRC